MNEKMLLDYISKRQEELSIKHSNYIATKRDKADEYLNGQTNELGRLIAFLTEKLGGKQ